MKAKATCPLCKGTGEAGGCSVCGKKKNKFDAKGVWCEGEYYGSQAEFYYASVLELLRRSGEIISYQHHPPFVILLRGGVKWRVDYLVVKDKHTSYYVEVKGYALPDFKKKIIWYRGEDLKHLPLFTVKQNRGSRTSFSIMKEYCVNPHKIEMA